MVARQTQQYMTHCRQDLHEAWSPDRHNITRHTVDKTRTKHGRQTHTTIHDTLSTRPAQSMVARQTQQYMTHCRQDPHKAWSPDRHNNTKHGRQTDTTLHDTLSTLPARSMVTRQTQQYMTHCRQDPHEAWSPDRHKITRHTVDKTRTKHGRQTDTTIHDTLSTRLARSMVTRQTQHYTTHCRQDPHKAWLLNRHNIDFIKVEQCTNLKNIFQTISQLIMMHYSKNMKF